MITTAELTSIYDRPIVTEISPFRDFYRAEDYHEENFRPGSRKEHLSRLKHQVTDRCPTFIGRES